MKIESAAVFMDIRMGDKSNAVPPRRAGPGVRAGFMISDYLLGVKPYSSKTVSASSL